MFPFLKQLPIVILLVSALSTPCAAQIVFPFLGFVDEIEPDSLSLSGSKVVFKYWLGQDYQPSPPPLASVTQGGDLISFVELTDITANYEPPGQPHAVELDLGPNPNGDYALSVALASSPSGNRGVTILIPFTIDGTTISQPFNLLPLYGYVDVYDPFLGSITAVSPLEPCLGLEQEVQLQSSITGGAGNPDGTAVDLRDADPQLSSTTGPSGLFFVTPASEDWLLWVYGKAYVEGIAQGYLNVANGVQDSVIGVGNLVPGAFNAGAWTTEKLGLAKGHVRVPYMRSPDWSRNRIVVESGTGWSDSHNWSKGLGAGGVEIVGGTLFAKMIKLRSLGKLRNANDLRHVDELKSVSDEAADIILKSLDEAPKASLGPIRGPGWFDDIAKQATRNPNSDKLVLGHFAPDGTTYQKVAAHYRSTYFKVENWSAVTKGLSADEIWRINKTFLTQQVKQGKQILFSHNPLKARANSFFEREVDFLRDLGYKFRQKNKWTWEAYR